MVIKQQTVRTLVRRLADDLTVLILKELQLHPHHWPHPSLILDSQIDQQNVHFRKTI